MIFAGFISDILNALAVQAKYFFTGAAVQIPLVGIMNQFLRLLLTHVIGNAAAPLRREGQLAVRKSAGAAPAGGNAANLAFAAKSLGALRANPFFNATSHVDNQYFLLRF